MTAEPATHSATPTRSTPWPIFRGVPMIKTKATSDGSFPRSDTTS